MMKIILGLILVGSTVSYAAPAENLPGVKNVKIDSSYGCYGGKDRDEQGNEVCPQSLVVTFTVDAYSCHSYLPEVTHSQADGSMQLVIHETVDANCKDTPTISEKTLQVGMSGPFYNPIGAISVANPILANQSHR